MLVEKLLGLLEGLIALLRGIPHLLLFGFLLFVLFPILLNVADEIIPAVLSAVGDVLEFLTLLVIKFIAYGVAGIAGLSTGTLLIIWMLWQINSSLQKLTLPRY